MKIPANIPSSTTILRLNNNDITTAGPNVRSGLPSLTELIIKCGGITSSDYQQFQRNKHLSWECPNCLLPNATGSFFLADDTDISHNPFQSLSDINTDEEETINLANQYYQPKCTKIKEVQGSKPLYTGCFYRQPKNDAVSLQKLDESLGRLTHNQNLPNIVLTRDFNVPDIQWTGAYSIRSPQQYNLAVNETILNITNEHNLEQQNSTPTRGINILDLVFTTNKNLKENITVESGISDHEAVIVDIKTRVKLTKKPPRKTFLYSKGNIPCIKTRLKEEFPEYINKTNDNSLETCWETFKTLLTSLMYEHIPQKTCTSRWNIPWITRDIKRAMRRKQRLYNRAKKTKKEKDWIKFKDIRRTTKN
ncbi:unnamed protein product [Mytilus coruscus]|uniref:Endonuclease/exonuclease/phosphatase domain-containing protein n=1 Tax=Mytilus coruscus TaxID=42192 RepID=A0A6J8EWU8_MYTCO|nr:unnamed protein product [Mytilus coruscus]